VKSEQEYRSVADEALDRAFQTSRTDQREAWSLLAIAATMAADAVDRRQVEK